MGSKARLATSILPFIQKALLVNKAYVEPFLGGANMMSEVVADVRIGGEFNKYVAAMWTALIGGWVPEVNYSREDYNRIKSDPDYCPHIRGYVGICCSYSGKWFGGYAGITNTAGGLRDYQKEAHNNVMKQLKGLVGVEVKHCSYEDLRLDTACTIYCDPPYRGTTKYKDEFDSDKFFEWARHMVEQGHILLVSEYQAPTDFVELWRKDVKSSLSANGSSGGSKTSTERLFCHQSQAGLFLC
ncbi:putative DNA adenine methylase [Pseudomonas phage MR4]|uniref:site-specific DNA-methyltransferase (adenine-specific) n=1 Tax=Pseudomonas phage MR4 TaxID=2711171 RepID=A0A6M3TAB0_9CAUD|nr:putative DNA adenine methylase [Pseudomonas phage MR4]